MPDTSKSFNKKRQELGKEKKIIKSDQEAFYFYSGSSSSEESSPKKETTKRFSEKELKKVLFEKFPENFQGISQKKVSQNEKFEDTTRKVLEHKKKEKNPPVKKPVGPTTKKITIDEMKEWIERNPNPKTSNLFLDNEKTPTISSKEIQEILKKEKKTESVLRELRKTNQDISPHLIQSIFEQDSSTTNIGFEEMEQILEDSEREQIELICKNITETQLREIIAGSEEEWRALTKTISIENLHQILKETVTEEQLRKIVAFHDSATITAKTIKLHLPLEDVSTTEFKTEPTNDLEEKLTKISRNTVKKQWNLLEEGDYFVGEKPLLKSGMRTQVFEAFRDKDHTQKLGILKLAKKGEEKPLLKEILFAKQNLIKHLQHENIINYFKTGINAEGLPFIVCEELSTFHRDEMLLEDAVCIVTKISELISYLSENRLYHQNIRPENISYSISETKIIPKLINFGSVSRRMEIDFERSFASSSPFFIAPEILADTQQKKIKSSKQQINKAEVFSLGMTLLGLLGFNPIMDLKPELSQKELTQKEWAAELREIYENQENDFFAVIENFIATQKWTPSYVEEYGLTLTLHRQFINHLIPILHKSLNITPKERPLIASFNRELEFLFLRTFNLSTEQYFENKCCFKTT